MTGFRPPRLNTWICRKFAKGSVRISDVFFKFMNISTNYAFAIIVFVVSGILFNIIENGLEYTRANSVLELMLVFMKAWLIPVKIFFILAITGFIIYKISEIKIAECTLRENEISAQTTTTHMKSNVNNPTGKKTLCGNPIKFWDKLVDNPDGEHEVTCAECIKVMNQWEAMSVWEH